MIRKNYRNKKQAGFTLVELIFVVALLGILSGAAIFAIDFTGKKEQIESVSLQIWAAQNMQRAIVSRYTLNGNKLTGTTDALLEATGDVKSTTPGNRVWNVKGSPTAERIIIEIVTARNSDATALATQLGNLVSGGMISAVAASNKNVDITYDL